MTKYDTLFHLVFLNFLLIKLNKPVNNLCFIVDKSARRLFNGADKSAKIRILIKKKIVLFS